MTKKELIKKLDIYELSDKVSLNFYDNHFSNVPNIIGITYHNSHYVVYVNNDEGKHTILSQPIHEEMACYSLYTYLTMYLQSKQNKQDHVVQKVNRIK